MNARQRKNLLKLAEYLESLPRDYKHFDMSDYAHHYGECELPMEVNEFAAKSPQQFLINCGTVACAVGHGPAAGISLRPDELRQTWSGNVNWFRYAARAFAAEDVISEGGDTIDLYDFLFQGDWAEVDNHHYGAAARIRYFLDTGRGFDPYDHRSHEYAPYRKGSRSAKRREIDAVLA